MSKVVYEAKSGRYAVEAQYAYDPPNSWIVSSTHETLAEAVREADDSKRIFPNDSFRVVDTEAEA